MCFICVLSQKFGCKKIQIHQWSNLRLSYTSVKLQSYYNKLCSLNWVLFKLLEHRLRIIAELIPMEFRTSQTYSKGCVHIATATVSAGLRDYIDRDGIPERAVIFVRPVINQNTSRERLQNTSSTWTYLPCQMELLHNPDHS